jgi:plasmid maintenance system antidote protein VapI
MLYIHKRAPVDIDLAEYISAGELADKMGIYEESARELITGKIEFNEREIQSLFRDLGIAAAV